MGRKHEQVNLSPEREGELLLIAEAVWEEYAGEEPVDPIPIIESAGLTYSYGRYQDAFDGLLEYRDGQFHVYCNLDRLDHPERPRARFTLAHELGHYFIDEHRWALKWGPASAHPSFAEYQSNRLVEREADVFATNLLMPPERFNEIARKAPAGMEGLLELVDCFGTSVTSTAIRYAKAEIVPCAVIKWHPDGYAWKWLSQEVFRRRYVRTTEVVDDLPRGSATRNALATEETPTSGFFQCGSTASFWFDGVDETGERNVILREEAIPMGEYGAITLLYPDGRSF